MCGIEVKAKWGSQIFCESCGIINRKNLTKKCNIKYRQKIFIIGKYRIITCEICDKELTMVHYATKYCKECNIEHKKEYFKKYSKSEKSKEYKKNYFNTHKERIKEYYNNIVTNLEDPYIKMTLKMKDAPPDLIELKRLQLMILRECEASK